jgi:hypothetical protein
MVRRRLQKPGVRGFVIAFMPADSTSTIIDSMPHAQSIR